MPKLSTAHCVPTAASIAELVGSTYDIGPIADCRFLTPGLNDTYGLTAGAQRYVLRCYRSGWRHPEDIAYELDALLHLNSKGLCVATPIARRDGELVGHVDCPEGARATVLFTHATGRLPKSVDDSHRYGEALARIHNAMDDFTSNAGRFPLDLRHLLDQPLDLILPWVAARPADCDYLKGLADRLRDDVKRRRADLSTGFCYGDAWGGNAHMTDRAVTFFDFDCYGEGWRSDELAIFVYGQALLERPDAAEHCTGYLAGYRVQSTILRADLEAIPIFVLLRQIWHLGLHIGGADHWGAGWIDDAYFDKRFANLRHREKSRMADLLPPEG